MLFDTHAHYDAEQFDADRDTVLSAMAENGVGLIIDPGCDIPSSKKATELAERYPFVYAAVGYQPESCGNFKDEDMDILRAMAKHQKVKAIGEIGLDYYWPENPPKELQRHVFHRHMELAEELNLPVIVHDREAHGDAMETVRAFPNVRGVFHCYAGSWEMAKELFDLGWYISFTGVVTFKNARKAVEIVEKMPLDRLMLETDSPYMAPEPVRGRRNSSLNLVHIARKIADIRGLSLEEVARITTENGKRFFDIP